MAFLIGPVGNLLVFNYMGQGVGASLDLVTAVQRALGGARTVDVIGQPRRTFEFARKYVNAAELSQFEMLALGGYGPGPYVLIDPWRRNLLSANQSSGTDVLGDTTDFAAQAGAITSSAAQASMGTRSLAWAVTASGSNVLTGDIAATATADPLLDIPVLPSTSYAAQILGRLSGSTGTVRLDLRWYTAAGVGISTAGGTPVALSTGAFTPFSAIATSPANAALLRIAVNNTVMGAAQTIYLDQFQLAQDTALPAWTFGTGVPRVAFTALSDAYPITPYHDVACTLVEVG